MIYNKTLILIRHGEAETNIMGIVSCDPGKYHLTENGIMQAQKAADDLYGLFKDKLEDISIYSSPILRAKETAKIIAEKLNIKEIKTENNFKERWPGVDNNKKVEDCLKNEIYEKLELKEKLNYPKHPGGETWTEILMRMNQGLENIINTDKNKIIIIVSHGDPLTMLRNYLLKRDVLCLFDHQYYFNRGEYDIIKI